MQSHEHFHHRRELPSAKAISVGLHRRQKKENTTLFFTCVSAFQCAEQFPMPDYEVIRIPQKDRKQISGSRLWFFCSHHYLQIPLKTFYPSTRLHDEVNNPLSGPELVLGLAHKHGRVLPARAANSQTRRQSPGRLLILNLEPKKVEVLTTTHRVLLKHCR
jgi:hypothetical protein